MTTNQHKSAWWPLVIRLALGIVFIAHGSDKLFRTFTPSEKNTAKLVEMKIIDQPATGQTTTAPATAPATQPLQVRNVYKLATAIQAWGWPMPKAQAWLVAFAEFGGGILLLLGFLARLGALAVIAVMLGAIFMVHWQSGVWPIFDQKWLTHHGGWEYPGFLALLAVTILISGAGRFSIDAMCCKPKEKSATP